MSEEYYKVDWTTAAGTRPVTAYARVRLDSVLVHWVAERGSKTPINLRSVSTEDFQSLARALRRAEGVCLTCSGGGKVNDDRFKIVPCGVCAGTGYEDVVKQAMDLLTFGGQKEEMVVARLGESSVAAAKIKLDEIYGDDHIPWYAKKWTA